MRKLTKASEKRRSCMANDSPQPNDENKVIRNRVGMAKGHLSEVFDTYVIVGVPMAGSKDTTPVIYAQGNIDECVSLAKNAAVNIARL
jgi:hypothetical protein